MAIKTAFNKNKNLIAASAFMFAIFPEVVMARTLDPIPGVPNKSLDQVLRDITNWLLDFGILVCILVIIYGGVTYIASTGDQGRIKQSKSTIHYAIWGLAIIGFSYAIIKLINDILT